MGNEQNRARAAGSLDPVTRTVQSMANPISRLVSRTWDQSATWLGNVANIAALQAENERLRTLQSSAAFYTEEIDRLKRDYDALRKLLDVAATETRTALPADVIQYFPLERRVTLNVGTAHGVQVRHAVVGADGLVGVVQTVSDRSCQVLLISSPLCAVGAVAVERDPPTIGIVKGENEDAVTFDLYGSKAPIAIGDLIATSGLSERIPRGIPIGRVVEVDDDPENGIRRARVFPFVRIGRLREVVVLK